MVVLRNETMRAGFALMAMIIGVISMLAPWQGSARAEGRQEAPQAAAGGDSAPDFQDWLAALRDEARAKGISEATLNAALRDVAPVTRAIELDRRQPEFTQTFWTYLDQRVNERRRERGRMLLATHRRLLDRIHAEHGVPPRYIIAFWGLETNFGDYRGSFRVVDTLATLAYDQRRSHFFRAQLLDALRIIEDGHILPDAMLGSWAGAMGHMQFMPSTFIGHAVDYTGDGRKDIWGSLPDAFSSAANFLSNVGWQPNQTWGREVRLPENFDLLLATLNTRKSLTQWSALGVCQANGRPLPHADMQGSIVLPQGHSGPAFLVYDNFRVIMRWNHSINYAISVGHLADRIVGMPQIMNGRDAEHAPLSRNETEEMQQLLNRLGFDAGSADGIAGPRTRAAIRALQQELSLPADGYPAPALLQRLRALAATLT
jgi:membrane-bound lytic murein transglycosylase B